MFQLALDTGELRRSGVRVRLQGKPFQLLQALLERPGEVVTREELQRRLWPQDTFVDFESGLNTAANRLRLALGDSAENPRFVETLARTGYRFVAPWQEVLTPPEAIPEPAGAPRLLPARAKRTMAWAPLIALAAVVASGAIIFFMTRTRPAPQFVQLTFRRGQVSGARFAPGGQSIVYAAKWANEERQRLYAVSVFSPESRALEYSSVALAGVSRKGELAFFQYDPDAPMSSSRLCRVPLNGGAPRAIGERIHGADWSPDAESFALVRADKSLVTVEYPSGKVVYRSTGWITDLRVSPKGDAIAFAEHPLRTDDAGGIVLVTGDRSRVLSSGWASVSGLAWSPSGKEIWFTAARSGILRSLYAVNRNGAERMVYRLPGTLRLFDISRDGRVLLSRDTLRLTMGSASFEGGEERDLSWFDWSRVQDLSADDNLVLFDESGEGGGSGYGVYVYNRTTRATTHVGSGFAQALSPDGNWALTLPARDRRSLRLVPLGPGQPRTIPGHGLEYQWAGFFPDGQRLLVAGNHPGHNLQLFIQSLSGEKPVTIAPEVFLEHAIVSPDAKRIAGVNANQRIELLPLDGAPRKVIDSDMALIPVRWSAKDPNVLYARSTRFATLNIVRVRVDTGAVEPWKKIAPADPAGALRMAELVMSSDARTYVYSCARVFSELFAVEGWL